LPASDPGYYKATVAVAVAWDKFARLVAQFGMTPSDRARLRVPVEPRKGGVMSRKR
jgi:hypothetical protein